MPGEKLWTSAAARRAELSEKIDHPARIQVVPPATQCDAAPAAAPQPAPSEVRCARREHSPGTGWDLPERRQYRFRIQDIAD
jgi:hypothetical protein